ncbi:MAG: hypothetical protein ACTSRU_16235 [Candidatus Hodarchaeales archaeon]
MTDDPIKVKLKFIDVHPIISLSSPLNENDCNDCKHYKKKKCEELGGRPMWTKGACKFYEVK